MHRVMNNRKSILFTHQPDIPFLGRGMAPVCLTVASQIPLFSYFPLAKGKFVIPATKDKHSFTPSESAVTLLFAFLLRLTTAPCADWSFLFASTHKTCNVMRGRRLSLRHSVKHYKAPGINDLKFITVNGTLKILYYLVYIFIRYILDFLLVVNGKKVDTGICCFNNNVQRDDPKSTSLATAFALNAKANLAFASTKRYSNIRIGLQFVLKNVNVIRKRAIAFGQTFCLTEKLFCIIKCNHNLSSFCPKQIGRAHV